MWTIVDKDVLHFGRSPGGDRFTELVDSVIRVQAFVCGISDSEIRTNLRTNIRDGGVDTEVSKSGVGETSGWLKEHMTIWQYKATDAGNVNKSTIEEEINKTYARDCINRNYAYRLCICDSITASKKEKIERILESLIQHINPNAPKGKVLAVSDIAAWLNHFPALVMRYFRPGISALHLASWRNSITDLTPKFIDVPAWQNTMDQIKKHANFQNRVIDVVMSISGEAGVGKTRMVYESLNSIPLATQLVVYTNDYQNTYNLAAHLANNTELYSIVVVDECDVSTREKLRDILRGARARVRILTIDNSGERSLSPAPQFWLEKMPLDIVEKILAENYHNVPEHRRQIYANLAGGFVRLAADLCNHDALIVEAGNVEPISGSIRDYLNKRLEPDKLEVLLALSLFTKVGMKGEISFQLKDLCDLIGLEKIQFDEIANNLHDTCGFVGRGGRYYYVTPEIIAHIGFDLAWCRWAKEPEAFLAKMPSSLLEAFLKRVSKSAKEEVRRLVGNFFRKRANTLTGAKLTDVRSAMQIVTLIEVEPQNYLPILDQIIEGSSHEELLNIKGYSSDARWGPRRLIVWLLERMSAFPNHFTIVERILLKLALSETEPHIGNNATGVWKQLFRISLSGTSIPFVRRLNRLRGRIFSDDSKVSNLATDALDNVFRSMFTGRIVTGPTVIAGQIPPEQWNPRSNQEYIHCINNAMILLQDMIKSNNPELQKNAVTIVIEHVRTLLRLGFLEKIEFIFAKMPIGDKPQLKLIDNVESFLKYDGDAEKGIEPKYICKVQKWVQGLITADFHGKLLMLVGIGSWHHLTLEDDAKWKADMRLLAAECVENPNTLEKEIEWLFSSEARDAMTFGDEIGKLDRDAVLLDMMFRSAIQCQCSTLARGYIHGLIDTYPTCIEQVNNWLNNVQSKNPILAYELFMAGSKATKAVERALRLIDDKNLPITYLRGFTSGLRTGSITNQEFQQILERLVKAAGCGDKSASRIAVELIAYGLVGQAKEQTKAILGKQEIQLLVWHLMEMTASDGGENSHWWAKVLELYASVDVDRATKIAAQGVLSTNLDHKRQCEKVLIDISHKHPEIVMNRLGEIIMDKDLGWHFFIDTYRGLISVLPESVVIDWVRENGVEAARRLARHLPKPYISSDGVPTVPTLTKFVLKEYEDDDRTFHEFCAGIHAIETYSGDIAARHEQEAEVAQKFFTHPLRRISEWARIEYDDAIRQAEQWRQFRQELELE